jgi:hypothetical protein
VFFLFPLFLLLPMLNLHREFGEVLEIALAIIIEACWYVCCCAFHFLFSFLGEY